MPNSDIQGIFESNGPGLVHGRQYGHIVRPATIHACWQQRCCCVPRYTVARAVRTRLHDICSMLPQSDFKRKQLMNAKQRLSCEGAATIQLSSVKSGSDFKAALSQLNIF
jgi:hypothetical protein